jgi:simple sugar transport system ATP-binding protein
MRDRGVAVLLVSAELDEIRSLADRIAVIYHGCIVDTVYPDEVTKSELGLMMAGSGRQEAEKGAA